MCVLKNMGRSGYEAKLGEVSQIATYMYVIFHTKTNCIALNANLRYEPNSGPKVIIGNLNFL